MATKTSKYELQKKEDNDFYNIEDLNANWDKVENALTEFDDSGTAEGITSFTDMLAKLVTGNKLAVTLRNLKAGLQFVLHTGSIVNNCVTDNAKLPLSAAQGKALQDAITKLNGELGKQYWSLLETYNVSAINSWTRGTKSITLPAGTYIIGQRSDVNCSNSIYLDTRIDTFKQELSLYEKASNIPATTARNNVVEYRSCNNVFARGFPEKTTLYFFCWADSPITIQYEIWAIKIK